MKNRYGMDGLTFNATIDTTTGHVELDENNEGVDITKPAKQILSNDWNNNDLSTLRNKFSEIENLI
jgi:hypothetical protein